MPTLLKRLPAMCSSLRPALGLRLRSYSVESSLHSAVINRAMLNLGAGTRQWPLREDWFAARQIMLQKQNQTPNLHCSQSRCWSNSSRRLGQATRRRRRQFGVSQDLPAYAVAEMDSEVQSDAHKGQPHRQAADWTQEQERSAHDLAAQNYEMDAPYDDQRVGTVREVIFGQQQDDHEDEDELERRRYSEELRRRVSAQKIDYSTPQKEISRKVICPYPSYMSHRSRWAEFRHAMIYGRASF
ncbi:uncharacterized protein LOC117582330 [Drosophila guanche]|uniref:Uncharacterized protein n=1 Tax=Drosophila guanche TaxID=7266 RepID=A0A3B0JRF5_DROGU|nr:uncharacterized protein LOC117582330 [Drosophila guanche]SPP73718.1 Hypothetical predicted protein [Drosophila guanche]